MMLPWGAWPTPLLDCQLLEDGLQAPSGYTCVSTAQHNWTGWLHCGEPVAALTRVLGQEGRLVLVQNKEGLLAQGRAVS